MYISAKGVIKTKEKNMIKKNINEFDKEKVNAGKDTFKQVLIGNDVAPNFAMRRFIIDPGGEMPFHKNWVLHHYQSILV